jgi:hypothetical protein
VAKTLTTNSRTLSTHATRYSRARYSACSRSSLILNLYWSVFNDITTKIRYSAYSRTLSTHELCLLYRSVFNDISTKIKHFFTQNTIIYQRWRCHAFDHGFFRAFVVRGFLVSVTRSYIQQSSPGQREGLKGGFEERVDGWGCNS